MMDKTKATKWMSSVITTWITTMRKRNWSTVQRRQKSRSGKFEKWICFGIRQDITTFSLATTGIDMSNISTSCDAWSRKFSAKFSSSSSPRRSSSTHENTNCQHKKPPEIYCSYTISAFWHQIYRSIPDSSPGNLSSCVTRATGYGVSWRISSMRNRQSPVISSV